MPLKNSIQSYGIVAMTLHWIMAVCFFGQIGIGIAMTNLPLTDPRTFPLYQTHKSLGILLFCLAVLRLVWRLSDAPPALPSQMPLWQVRASKAVHLGLYASFIVMPLLGWVIVSASPYGIPTYFFGLVQLPHLAFVVESPARQSIGDAASYAHWALAWAVSFLILGHIGAALWHHFRDRDDVLRRMLPARLLYSERPDT
tara:strand:- start:2030 stop:2626 length:597 start_codon:yes stop_codon:yes gene_type:complete